MREGSRIQTWFDYVHYTRLPFCVVALTLTAASGAVLAGRIDWQPAVIVGLATYAVYNLDNLLDWKGEKPLLQTMSSRWNAYLIWCAATIPFALMGILLLGSQAAFSLQAFLVMLAIISMAHVLLTRQSGDQQLSAVAFWAENLIDSLTWALAAVLTPVLYADRPIVAQTIMAVAYVWHLSWIGTAVWEMTSAATGGKQSPARPSPATSGGYRLVGLLQIVSVSSLVLAVVDIALGYFPWYNIAVISAPIVNLGLLSLWKKLDKAPVLYANLFFVMDALCSLLVIATYALAE